MSQLSPTALSTAVREVVTFVDGAGWDQPPQLFALVPTAELAAAEPGVADQLSAGAELTPVAQEGLPGAEDGGTPALDAALARLSWPPAVAGCVLVQEILVLPPDAEAELDDAVAHAVGAPGADEASAEQAAIDHAARHPARREARLVAAVLRGGDALCLLQLRPAGGEEPTAVAGQDGPELLEHPELAPNLVAALRATLD
ncbi:PPA1309 family protein [Rhodococcus aerolatus]